MRLALGSHPGGVVRLVLLESTRDLALGAVAGLAGGAALCALLARSMENIGSVDAMTTGVAIGSIAPPRCRIRRLAWAAPSGNDDTPSPGLRQISHRPTVTGDARYRRDGDVCCGGDGLRLGRLPSRHEHGPDADAERGVV